VATLIYDALPLCRLWYGEPKAVSNAVDYAKFYSRSHDAVIRVYDDGNMIETHEQGTQTISGGRAVATTATAALLLEELVCWCLSLFPNRDCW